MLFFSVQPNSYKCCISSLLLSIGLAALADGSFGGQTMALVASSYKNPGAWGAWKLFRSNLGVGTSGLACEQCAPTGCDHSCSTASMTKIGTCAYPGSADPTRCCACSPYIEPMPCAKCASSAGGCVELCVNNGHPRGGILTGMCSDDPDWNPSSCSAHGDSDESESGESFMSELRSSHCHRRRLKASFSSILNKK